MSSNAVNYFTNWKDTQRPWPTKKTFKSKNYLRNLQPFHLSRAPFFIIFGGNKRNKDPTSKKTTHLFPALGWMLKNWIHFLLGHHFSHSLTLDGNRKPARGSIHTTIPWASRTILRFCGREGSHNLHFGLRFQGSCVVKGRNCGGREWKFYEQVTIGTIACLHI